MKRWILAIVAAGLAAGCTNADRVVHSAPLTYTRPVPVNEVQDCAFWIHPTQPERSLLLVTNEKRGLEVHNLDGLLLKHLDDRIEPQYVDVIYDVPTGSGVRDLVLATCRAPDSMGVHVWAVDVEKAKLVEIERQSTLAVLGDDAPLGLFTYHSSRDGGCYIFVTNDSGAMEQYELSPDIGSAGVTAKRVRSFKLVEKAKCGVADPDAGVMYVACEKTGVWQFDAEPDRPSEGKLVIKAGENGLAPHVRGPALYRGANGHGYLLVGSQGSKAGSACVNVYERGGDHRFLLTIDPAPGALGTIEHSSGFDVTSMPTTARFPAGVLAINDQLNDNGSEDFKLYSWADIARAGGLIVDTRQSPRLVPSPTTKPAHDR